ASAAFAGAMNEDLNIAAAIAAVNSWTGNVGEPAAADAAFMGQLDFVLGVLSLERPAAVSSDIGVFAPGLNPDPSVEDLLRKRRDARAAKDFKASDQIRDQLAAMGYAIKDMAGGKVEVRRA
ncbi:MAG: cysteine--tRNA ligase, partial [Planctomycetota bacterium]|nr:cysteine--tRNA ligase [Planctomycetota bacterium]